MIANIYDNIPKNMNNSINISPLKIIKLLVKEMIIKITPTQKASLNKVFFFLNMESSIISI